MYNDFDIECIEKKMIINGIEEIIEAEKIIIKCNSDKKDVVIPEDVTEIKSYAFSDNAVMESIEFPKNLKKIGKFSFANCVALKEISIPSNVEVIEESAFCECKSLVKVVYHTTKLDYIPSNCFANCKYLKHVTLSDSIKRIKKESFKNCVLLEIIDIPSIKNIEADAFYNCISLNTVNCNKLVGIDSQCFNNCPVVESKNTITVPFLFNIGYDNCRSSKVYAKEFEIDSIDLLMDEIIEYIMSVVKKNECEIINFNSAMIETVTYGNCREWVAKCNNNDDCVSFEVIIPEVTLNYYDFYNKCGYVKTEKKPNERFRGKYITLTS